MGIGVPANALLALAAALVWGGGDFSGSMGVKDGGGSLRAALRVVLLSHATSLAVLLVVAVERGDWFPHGAVLAWGVCGGLAGCVAICAFYIALSRGAMGAPAAVSGLLAAAIPAVLSAFLDGTPGLRRTAGFLTAGLAIWLIAAGTQPKTDESDRGTMALAIASGAGFGFYFICLKLAGAAGVVWPMATARMGSTCLCVLVLLVLMRSQRRSGVIAPALLPMRGKAVAWALGAALLDTSGNMFFIAASRAGRLDVASVLASLYPATTILLAACVLKEAPTWRQGLGMGVAVVAVVLITI